MPRTLLLAALLAAAAAAAAAASPLDGRVALITGGNSGIGLAVAKHLAGKGMKVVLAARSISKGEAAVAEIEAAGGTAAFVQTDVASASSQRDAFLFAEERYGGVDAVFANAGVSSSDFSGWDRETDVAGIFDFTFGINVRGVAISLNEAALAFRKQNRKGVFVACSSYASTIRIGAVGGFGANGMPPLWMSYMASKAAVDSMIRSATSLPDFSAVYSLNPSFYASNMVDNMFDKMSAQMSAMQSLDDMAAIDPVFPFTMGNPSDLGPVVEAFFDGSTKYKSGDAVVTDDDATITVEASYGNAYNRDPLSSGITRDDLRDARGDAYPQARYDANSAASKKNTEDFMGRMAAAMAEQHHEEL